MLGILLTLVAFAQFIDKRYETSLLLFFGLITNGYQLIPQEMLLAGSPLEKTTDLALFYMLAIIACRFSIVRQAVINEFMFRWVLAFLIFVVADALYSYLLLHYALPGIVKLFRNYLFLLSFGVFITVPVPVLIRVLHVIALITVFQSALYLLQIATGLTLLSSGASGSDVSIHQMEEIGYTRFYNTPTYLIPVLFYYLFAFRFRSKLTKVCVISLLLLAAIGPLHRVNMIAVFVVIGLTVLLRQRGRQRPVLMLLVGAFGYVVTLIDVVNYRINEAILDVTKTFSGSLANADYTENTSSFRIMHFMERFTYIMKLPHGWLIGLGLLHEDTPQAANLSFEVGNFSKHVGRISQTETSDLLYSLLLTQLGIVGMILYLVVLFQFARFLYQRMRTTPYCLVGFLWLVQALLTSISGVELALIPFRTLIMLFLVVVLKSSIRPLVRPTEASPDKLVAVY